MAKFAGGRRGLPRPKKPTYGGGQFAGGRHGLPGPGTPASAGYAGSAPAPAAAEARPPDWQEQLATTTANRNVALSNAQATYDTGRIQRDFGYAADGSIDQSNPYSQAMMLEQQYKQSTMGTTNSMAAQGQLYSGATQNAQNENTRQHSIGVNQNQNAYQDALGQVKLNQLGTYAQSGGALTEEQFQALLRQLGGGR